MEKKLWVVTHIMHREDWDDFNVIAVCDTLELAKAIMREKAEKIEKEWSETSSLDDMEITHAPGYSSINNPYGCESDDLYIEEFVLNSKE